MSMTHIDPNPFSPYRKLPWFLRRPITHVLMQQSAVEWTEKVVLQHLLTFWYGAVCLDIFVNQRRILLKKCRVESWFSVSFFFNACSFIPTYGPALGIYVVFTFWSCLSVRLSKTRTIRGIIIVIDCIYIGSDTSADFYIEICCGELDLFSLIQMLLTQTSSQISETSC